MPNLAPRISKRVYRTQSALDRRAGPNAGGFELRHLSSRRTRTAFNDLRFHCGALGFAEIERQRFGVTARCGLAPSGNFELVPRGAPGPCLSPLLGAETRAPPPACLPRFLPGASNIFDITIEARPAHCIGQRIRSCRLARVKFTDVDHIPENAPDENPATATPWGLQPLIEGSAPWQSIVVVRRNSFFSVIASPDSSFRTAPGATLFAQWGAPSTSSRRSG